MGLFATQREISTSYNIRFGAAAGTCCSWKDDKGTFFVTAAHVLATAAEGNIVEFRQKGGWVRVRIQEIVRAPTGVDICVFSSENFRLTFRGSADVPNDVVIQLGQDLLFVGYPHGLVNNADINGDFVTALVRKASFSGVIELGDHPIMILDGFNNPGYSGSPVYTDHDGHLVPVAVISGYRFETRAHGGVFKAAPDGSEDRLPDVYVKPNSGMIYAYSWGYVVDALRELQTRNPPGPQLNEGSAS